jgi:2-C-methyl-D-erythritol 2,4-cyclodiphosphate synthase
MSMRVGHGYDVHRLVDGRPLYLAGVEIPHSRGLLGHSDGDVVLHALCDAILGALGAGDIGEHFPDADPRYRGIASSELLQQVVIRMRQQGWRVENIDVTICAEEPKLAPHRPLMRARVADLAGVAPDRVSIKAKTNEGLDAVGRGEAIAATAVVAIEKT